MTASPRKAIKKISDRKLKSLGGKVPFSSISSTRKAVRKQNPKRKASEFKRCYGSKERVLFVKGLPCSACGDVGYSENAHVPPKGEAGTGYKADYRFIVPLCGLRWRDTGWHAGFDIGCHGWLHRYGRAFIEERWGINLTRLAAETERAWKAHTEEGK